MENFNSFFQLLRRKIFELTKISQNWNRNASKHLCTASVILFDCNQKMENVDMFWRNFSL